MGPQKEKQPQNKSDISNFYKPVRRETVTGLPIILNVALPSWILTKWTKAVNYLAAANNVPVALITRIHEKKLEVLAVSTGEQNIFTHGASADLATGHYCEVVMRDKKELLITNALKDPEWDKNPDIELGLIAYYGVPITWPGGETFGTLCMLDTKENVSLRKFKDLVLCIKKSIELDLAVALQSLELEEQINYSRGFAENVQDKKSALIDELGKVSHDFINFTKYDHRLFSLLENTPDYIQFNDGNGNCLSSSSTFKALMEDKKIVRKIKGGLVQPLGDVQSEEAGKDQIDEYVWSCGHSVRFEQAYETVDGEVLLLDTVVVPSFDEDGSRRELMYISRDVTQKKLAETELLESSCRYQALFDTAYYAILLFRVNGEIVEGNEKALEILGIDSDGFAGKSTYDFFEHVIAKHDIDCCHISEKTLLALDGKPQRFECSCVKSNGSTFLAELSLNRVKVNSEPHLLGIFQDIAQRRLLEEERDRLALAVEQSSEAIAITDLEGTVQYVNPSYEKITGYARDELIGSNPRLLKSGLMDEDVYHELWKTISGGEVWNGELVNKKKSGDIYTEDATISPLLNRNGEIINYVGMKRDITHEKALEKQLYQAQKIEAVGQLAGGVAHDVNNILQAINGHAHLASLRIEKASSASANIEGILDACHRASLVIKHLLLFSHRETVKTEEMCINAIVNGTLKMLRPIIPKSIFMETSLGDDLPAVSGDPGQIEQILVNLCLNARDAIGRKGIIRISTQCLDIGQDSALLNDEFEAGQYICIKVEDTGCGMSEEILAQIFDPFFTTKAADKGTGLGLAAVQMVIAKHGGFVTAHSIEDTGTIFKIYLPVMEHKKESDVGADYNEAQDPASRGDGETILIAEDDEQILKIVSMLLETEGYMVIVANDGEECISLLEKNHDAISAAIIDVVMPKLDGRDVYEYMQSKGLSVPIIFTTGYSKELLTKENLLPKGDYMLLHKPFNTELLFSTLTAAIKQEEK